MNQIQIEDDDFNPNSLPFIDDETVEPTEDLED